MKRMTFLIDADDVLLYCNSYALFLLGKETGEQYSLSEITGWGKTGSRVDERMKYFQEKWFYTTQPAMPGAKEFIHELSQYGEVLIGTAVYPQFMSERCSHLMELFPDVKPENIIMGRRKDLIHTTMQLDDCAYHIESSRADYPVLFRAPWNAHMSGCLAANNYEEFLGLVREVQKCACSKMPESPGPNVLCFLAPSGSGKTAIADELLKNDNFEKVVSWTTRGKRPDDKENAYIFTDKDTFLKKIQEGYFFEYSVYQENYYGTSLFDVKKILDSGKHVVTAVDISGCMAMKAFFGNTCKIFYVQRDDRKILDSVLSRDVPKEQTINRILSLPVEKKNIEFADFVVNNNGPLSEAAEQVKLFLRRADFEEKN